MQFFSETWGIPPVLTCLAAYTEFIGGISLILGIFTRVFAFWLVIDMLVAVLVAHLPNGFFNPQGFEWPLTLLIVTLVVFLRGSGEYSIDSRVFSEEKHRPI